MGITLLVDTGAAVMAELPFAAIPVTVLGRYSEMKAAWKFVSVLAVIALAFMALSCGGGGSPTSNPPGGGPSQGGDTPNPPEIPNSPISLLISATPSSGPAPLQVNLFVSATGGREPYSYSWDFENDGVFDSTAQTPFHTYTVTSVARVRVQDASGNEANGYRTILVNGDTGGSVVQPLVAMFGMDKVAGPVPLEVKFTGFASGGTPPYAYSWDFDNDGTIDSYVKDPGHIYSQIGTAVNDATGQKWVYYPTLEVRDSVGRKAAFNAEINAMPASSRLTLSAFANPPTGQAPLLVSFDGGAEGGVPPYEFSWNFGEGESTPWSTVSQADHLYSTAGVFSAYVSVRDSSGLLIKSGNITVTVEDAQQLKAVIQANIVNSSVPFTSNFTSSVSGGKEPFTYNWLVYSLSSVQDDTVDPNHALFGTAIVSPMSPQVANPEFHFANQPLSDLDGNGDANEYDPILVQLVVTDANGNEAASNVITVTPQPPSFNYDAKRPATDTFVGFGANFGNPTPSNRVNPAVATHPYTGVTFMFGGDVVDGSGNFTGVVDLTNSAWAFNPNDSDVAYGTGWPAYSPVTYPANSWVELNTVRQSSQGDGSVGGIGGGPFPNGEMRDYNILAPPDPDPIGPAATTLRADQFVPRGSAAAIFIHEPVETNPAGADYSGCMQIAGSQGNTWPDDPADQGLDLNGMNGPGLGVPVIYVVGGRDASGTALTTVQKYYPPGFGTEMMPIDCWDACMCQTGDFQVTNNQVDIWRNTFLSPDRDFWPQVGEHPRPPIVRDRVPGDGADAASPLVSLPIGVYGHCGFAIESLPYLGNLPWPLGPFWYIFILGGKESDGHVSNEFRILDTRADPTGAGSGGNQNPRNPDYPYWSYVRAGNPVNGPVQLMPVERYDFDVVLQYADPSRGERWKLYVFGGTNQNGEYVDQVDVFTFENVYNPNTGTWSTLSAVMPEPSGGLNAAVGFDSVLGYIYHTFGGRTRDAIVGDVYTLQNDSTFVPSSLSLIPKYGAGMGFSFATPSRPASDPWDPALTYYRVAGFGPEGMNPYVEFFHVP